MQKNVFVVTLMFKVGDETIDVDEALEHTPDLAAHMAGSYM